MLGYVELPLKTEKGNKLVYNRFLIKKSMKELEEYLSTRSSYKERRFGYKEMFPNEISYNDKIENPLSSTIIFKKESPISRKNLYNGYLFIARNRRINKENIKKLYDILSKDLLDETSKELTGDYYRKAGVLIKNNEFDYDKAMPAPMVEERMDDLIKYINKEDNNSSIEEFLKSIIIHFYLVYIHPYNDVNGRTARTLATWYLLNKEEYPYLVFNRAIYQNKEKYKKEIRKARHTGDITSLINFMMKSVLKELYIEDIIGVIEKNVSLTKEEKMVFQSYYSLPKDKKTFNVLYSRIGIHDNKNKELIENMIIKGYFKTEKKDNEIFLSINEQLLKRKTKVNQK